MQATNPSGTVATSAAASRPAALDLAHASAVKDELLARLAVGPTSLDLASVTTCDLAGLQLLWAARASAHSNGQRFTVTNPSPAALAAAAAFGLDLNELQDTP